jgi:hypothetical protein
MFGVSLLDEYVVARAELAMRDEDLAAVARTWIQISGAPPRLVASATAVLDKSLVGSPAPGAGTHGH